MLMSDNRLPVLLSPTGSIDVGMAQVRLWGKLLYRNNLYASFGGLSSGGERRLRIVDCQLPIADSLPVANANIAVMLAA